MRHFTLNGNQCEWTSAGIENSISQCAQLDRTVHTPVNSCRNPRRAVITVAVVAAHRDFGHFVWTFSTENVKLLCNRLVGLPSISCIRLMPCHHLCSIDVPLFFSLFLRFIFSTFISVFICGCLFFPFAKMLIKTCNKNALLKTCLGVFHIAAQNTRKRHAKILSYKYLFIFIFFFFLYSISLSFSGSLLPYLSLFE